MCPMPVRDDNLAIPWPQVCLGRNSQTAAHYGVYGVPMYYVIGPDGKIIARNLQGNAMSWAVEKALKTLPAKDPE